MNANSQEKTRRLAGLALFTALIVILQLLGSFIRFGPVSVSLVALPIVVGAAGKNITEGSLNGTDGGTTSAFAASALGGKGSKRGYNTSKQPGADGGSGGGGLNVSGVHANYSTVAGGTDGGDGTTATTAGGKGQGTTTREFGEADGDLYASGGGDNLTATVPNSGNGGAYNIAPADGIVVIRQHKEVAA